MLISQAFDKDGSGALCRLEFNDFIARLGIFLTTQELTCIYNNFDANGDGMIHYNEFVNALRVSF